jgi:hypothetical protein
MSFGSLLADAPALPQPVYRPISHRPTPPRTPLARFCFVIAFILPYNFMPRLGCFDEFRARGPHLRLARPRLSV